MRSLSHTLAPTSKRPARFKAAGICKEVRLIDPPQFAAKNVPKGIKGKGIRYQDYAIDKLVKLVDADMPGPWVTFRSNGEQRWAQPDWLGFEFNKGRIYVVEMKLTRVPDAWWQLNRLYLPLLRQLFPKWELVPVEVVSKMAIVGLPEPVELVSDLRNARRGVTSVLNMEFKL